MHQNLQVGISSLHQQSIGVEEAVIQSRSDMRDHMDRRFDQIEVVLAGLKSSETSVRPPVCSRCHS